MALSKAEVVALFQVLRVPYASKHFNLDEEGLTQVAREAGDSFSAKVAIEAWLTTQIYADADLETELVSLLTRWIAMGTKTVELDGSVDDVNGVTLSQREERNLIRERVVDMVPFYRAHMSPGTGGNSLNIKLVI